MPEDDDGLQFDEDSVRFLDLPEIVAGIRSALAECGLPLSDANMQQRKNLPTLVAAINHVGIDGEAFVRYGCTYDLAWPLAIAITLDALSGGTAEGGLWAESLELNSRLAAPGLPPERFDLGEVAYSLLPTIRRWIHHAPFSDIVALNPPSPAVQREMSLLPDVSDELSDDYRWVADRLGGQRLASWSASSLKREYIWLRGADPCTRLPGAVLSEQPSTAAEVAQELADRHLLGGEPMKTSPPVRFQVEQQAKDLLHARRFSDAATLFEFMGNNDWIAADVCYNNRGFCLLPEEPRRALRFLQRAASAGYPHKTVNRYNQMCCMLALDDVVELRNTAERYWLEEFEQWPENATIWTIDGDGWVLKKTPDARECLARLALEVCERQGWEDRVDRWSMRLSALRNGEYLC